MSTFYSRLKESADYQKLSNRDIAAKIGVSPTNINNILKGDNKPNVETVIKLVEALGINGHWLLTGEGEMSTKEGSGLSSVANIAVGINGPNHQVQSTGADPCAALRTENELLRQRIADKDTIIALLQQQTHLPPRIEGGKYLGGEE